MSRGTAAQSALPLGHFNFGLNIFRRCILVISTPLSLLSPRRGVGDVTQHFLARTNMQEGGVLSHEIMWIEAQDLEPFDPPEAAKPQEYIGIQMKRPLRSSMVNYWD